MKKEVNEPASWSKDDDSDKRCPRKHKYDPMKCNTYCPWLEVCIRKKYCKPVNDVKMELLKTENESLKAEVGLLKTENDAMRKLIDEPKPIQQKQSKSKIEEILGTVRNIQREMFILNDEFHKFNEQPKPQPQVTQKKEEPPTKEMYICGFSGCTWKADSEKDLKRHREAEHRILS
jgi:hypothetical protein